MFDDIKVSSTSRLLEVRAVLDFIKTTTHPVPAPESMTVRVLKGMFYVHIYGVFEYTVTSVVQHTIYLINSLNIPLNSFKPILLSMVLNPEFDAIFITSNKKWEKRWVLFDKMENNLTTKISNDIFPTDGRNIRYAQLESIWKTFGVDAPILNNVSLGGRIKDIVANRNAIAHGNSSASEIGGRISIGDLYQRYNEMSSYISYIIEVFEEYITQEKYIA